MRSCNFPHCVRYIVVKIAVSYVCLFDDVNATFNNISVISWRAVLLVKETGGQTLSHNVVHLALVEIRTQLNIELMYNTTST